MLMQVAIKEFNKLYPRRCLVYEKKQLTKSQKSAAAANGFYAPRWSGNMFSERQAEQMCNFPEYCQELCKYTNNNPLQHRRARWMMMRSCLTGPSPPSKSRTKRLRRERRVLSVFCSLDAVNKLVISLNLTWHEWDNEVIHTLHVRCSRISYGSYVEDSFDGPDINDVRLIISWRFGDSTDIPRRANKRVSHLL